MLIFDTDLDTTARIIQIFGLPAIVGVIIWATKVFVRAQQEMKNTRDAALDAAQEAGIAADAIQNVRDNHLHSIETVLAGRTPLLNAGLESLRTQSESLKTQAEAQRIQAETMKNQAESMKGLAETQKMLVDNGTRSADLLHEIDNKLGILVDRTPRNGSAR